jgi:hypothetical protein
VTVEGANSASTFLAGMFGASTAAPVFICSLPNADARERERGERHVATREPVHIEAFLRKWDRRDRALYFAVATVKPGSITRSKATLAELNGLHVDIDAKSITIDIEEAEQKLREVMHLPSKVVASGGGLHGYWLFKEALPATPENIGRIETLLHLLADHLAGDRACAEASRLMRLPGSHNTKGGAWTEVLVVEDRPFRYDLDELAEWLETASPMIRRKLKGGNGHDAQPENPWLAVAARFGSKPPIDVEARLAAMQYQGAGDASIHSTQVAVSAALLSRGQPIDEVVDILITASRAAAGPFGARWDWQREERAIRQMCESWIAKHPEIVAEPANRETGQRSKATEEQCTPLMPYEPRPFSEIPLRQWLHAGHYIRQQIVMTAAPGGYGKTSLLICNAVEMATGRGLIGPAPPDGQLRVGFWNAEDPDEEIERRIAAVCLHHNIDPASLREWLFLGSRLTGNRRVASADRAGNVMFDTRTLAGIERCITDLQIDCVILDPLIAFHRIPEGNNTLMEQVIKDGFGEIATRANCCIELSQHTRKPSQAQQGELTADDARGAGAIVNAARSVRVLNRMTKEEAELPKIAPEERRHYLRVSRDKTNLAPAGKATWVRLVSVQLPNSEGPRPGDHVQAIETWTYPEALDGVSANDMYWMRDTARQGAYRRDPRSPDWIGRPLAKRLGLDADEPGDRKKLSAILKVWFANGVLAAETRKDASRHEREFIVPGAWSDDENERDS